jgi:hypothetical protein
VRISAIALAALLTAGCAAPARHRPSPSPSPSATTAPVPARQGTVHNDRTSFQVRVKSVRTTKRFYVGGRLADDAPYGTSLVIVRLVVRNVGHAASHLEATEMNPLILVDTHGGTSGITRSWATKRDFPPGAAVTEPYVFFTEHGVKPAYVTVTLTEADGSRSVAALSLPGHSSPSGGVAA